MKSFTLKEDGLLMALLVGLTLILRWPWHALVPLDIDEAFQLFVSSRAHLFGVVKAMHEMGPQQYPLDYLVGYVATRFTHDIGILRLLPMLWAVGSIAIVYCLGRIFWCRLFGWMWGLALSVSMLHIQYSITFRAYSLIVFLSLLSILSFWLSLENRTWVRYYGIVSALYALVYPFTFFKTVVDLVVAHKLKSLQARSISHAIFFSWGILVLMGIVHLSSMNKSSFGWDLSNTFGLDVLSRIALQYGEYSYRITILFTCLFFFGVIIGWRQSVIRLVTTYLGALFVATFIGLLVVVPTSGLFLRARHTLPLLPLFLGGMVVPLVTLAQMLGNRFQNRIPLIKQGVGIIGLIAACSLIIRPLQIFQKEIKSSVALINNQVEVLRQAAGPEDRLIFGNPNSGATFIYYFDRFAFFKLDGIKLAHGVDLFKFPPDLPLQGHNGSLHAYTLCRIDPSIATAVPSTFALRAPGQTYLVDLPLNYFKVDDPFHEIEAVTGPFEKLAPGIYRIANSNTASK